MVGLKKSTNTARSHNQCYVIWFISVPFLRVTSNAGNATQPEKYPTQFRSSHRSSGIQGRKSSHILRHFAFQNDEQSPSPRTEGKVGKSTVLLNPSRDASGGLESVTRTSRRELHAVRLKISGTVNVIESSDSRSLLTHPERTSTID